MNINKVIKEQLSGYFDGDEKFIVAVSGGPDSQCLLKAFTHVVGKDRCLAVGIDHGLRASANDELSIAEELATKVGVNFERIKVQVKKGPSVMAQAREARYSALFKRAGEFGTRFVVTGHNFDDQAETALIQMMRGQQMRQMKSIAPSQFSVPLNDGEPTFQCSTGMIFRPMLKIPRKDILGYLKRWGVPFAEDPSNSNPKYLRSWIRKELLPMMEEKSPQIRQFLNRLSECKY